MELLARLLATRLRRFIRSGRDHLVVIVVHDGGVNHIGTVDKLALPPCQPRRKRLLVQQRDAVVRRRHRGLLVMGHPLLRLGALHILKDFNLALARQLRGVGRIGVLWRRIEVRTHLDLHRVASVQRIFVLQLVQFLSERWVEVLHAAPPRVRRRREAFNRFHSDFGVHVGELGR